MTNIDVVTIGIAPTSQDPRLKHFVVALVHYTLITGELHRKGACFLGDRFWRGHGSMGALLHTQVKVQDLSTRAWEAWAHGKNKETFHDLNNLVTVDQRSKIRPLSWSLKQVNDMFSGASVKTAKTRLKDSKKGAKEVALSLRPKKKKLISAPRISATTK